jgi:hypothetical protein
MQDNVTQADREAAADLLESGGSKGILCRFDHAITIRHSENLDGDPFVQAFAAHRLASTTAQTEELVEAVERAAGIAGYTEREDLDFEAALSVVGEILRQALAAHRESQP